MSGLDKFDELYDKFKERKKSEKTDKKKKKDVGIINPEQLPLWQEVKQGNLDFNECAVCKQEFHDIDIVEACPHCNYYFHYKHIREWLKIKATCPVCNK